MDVDKPEANAQTIGDMLIAVERVHGAVGGGGAEAGDAENPSRTNDLPGAQNLQAILEIVPLIAGEYFIVAGLAGDTGHCDGAGEAGQGRDGNGLAEPLGTFQHTVVTGNAGLRNDNITGGNGGSDGVPLRFGILPVVGTAEGDGLHHLTALRQMILEKPQELLLLLGIGQTVIAGLEGVAFAKTAGAFIVIKMLDRDQQGKNTQFYVAGFLNHNNSPFPLSVGFGPVILLPDSLTEAIIAKRRPLCHCGAPKTFLDWFMDSVKPDINDLGENLCNILPSHPIL